jgi:hypothetical protein
VGLGDVLWIAAAIVIGLNLKELADLLAKEFLILIGVGYRWEG